MKGVGFWIVGAVASAIIFGRRPKKVELATYTLRVEVTREPVAEQVLKVLDSIGEVIEMRDFDGARFVVVWREGRQATATDARKLVEDIGGRILEVRKIG